eukprot:gb/GECG01003836.1/.p1 GENE.gb/GECG01003836.1/~~gb/GECG01003836.1/.p1  ORF type:complete len:298 (+),score=32.49 gb/GECG01003836.1/:1-894(+)
MQGIQGTRLMRPLLWTQTHRAKASVPPGIAKRAFATGKSYFLRPWPRYTPHDIQNWAQGKHHRNPPKHLQMQKLGPKVDNHTERRVLGAAKRYGFLQMEEHCGEAPCNEYYRYCFNVKRPYLALNKHGDEICVDLAPVAGPGKKGKAETDAVMKLKAAFSEAVGRETGVFTQNDQTRQATLDSVKELEKADDSLKELTQQDLNYVLQTKKRSHSITIARRLHKAFFTTLGRKSPQDLKGEREQLKQSRRDRKRQIVERRVLKLAELKKPHPQVPPGSLDGFLQARRRSEDFSQNAGS